MKKIIALTFTLTAIGSVATSQAALTTGLVTYYDFEDLNNSPDATGGPAASVNGTGSTVGTAVGVSGSGVEFTGTTGNFINTTTSFGAATASGSELGQNFTVSAWYNLDTDASSGASRFFIMEGDTDYDLSYGLRNRIDANGFNDAQTYTNAPGTNDQFANHDNVHTPGTWQHVALTYLSDGTNTIITTYIDGTAQAGTVTELTSALTSDGIHIGNNRGTNPSRAFDGKIDEFGAWSRVLTQAEITQAYQNGLNGNALTVPEPSSSALISLASLSFILRRRR